MADQSAAHEVPPYAQLIQMGMGYWASKLVLVAAQLGLADQLAKGARSSDDLAQELGLHAPSLYRFMRSLAGLGILTEVRSQTFGLTTLGKALQKDAPGSARAAILTLTGPLAARAWDELAYSVKTGKTGFERVIGKPLFDYLGEHPDQASLFSETMIGFHGAEPPAVAAAYDFDSLRSVVDVGGATGNLLAHILQHHKKPRGVLFDLPHVIEDATAVLKPRGVMDRVTLKAGSFFESVPEGHAGYVLSHIIHDWNEDQCATILGNCRRAMPRDGKLLIVEMVLPEGDTPHPGKMLDMMMLVGPGGQER